MLVLVISLISISNSELCNEILNDVLIKVQDLQKVVQDLIEIPKAGEIFSKDFWRFWDNNDKLVIL